jgi:inward rectifier potassium channel
MDSPRPLPPRPRYTGGSFSFRRSGSGVDALRDIYPTLLTTSWPVFLGLLTAAFVLVNAVFAALYRLGGDCFNATDPSSVLLAFSFSVQTISGIGYGAMAPTTPYAHAVSDVQAFVGLMGLALATGLVFARFARPTSRVGFSRNLLVRHRDGQPYLTFRLANERGNQLVEATLTVVALFEEVTAEGEHMRRLVDLPLERASSPVFSMSWTALHRLTPDSPLAVLARGAPHPDLVAVVANVMGVDGTLNQTVHKQYFYDADSVRWGHRFVDMIEHGADGVMTIHYGRLSDIAPDPAEQARLDAARSLSAADAG